MQISLRGSDFLSNLDKWKYRTLVALLHSNNFSFFSRRAALPIQEVPVQEVWRLGILDYLLLLRKDKYLEVQDSERICAMIDSLCSTWAEMTSISFNFILGAFTVRINHHDDDNVPAAISAISFLSSDIDRNIQVLSNIVKYCLTLSDILSYCPVLSYIVQHWLILSKIVHSMILTRYLLSITCYLHLLSVTCYMLHAFWCFYLKLAITCKNLFPFARCCMSRNFLSISLFVQSQNFLIWRKGRASEL